MKLYPNVTFIFIIWLISLLFISYLGFLTLPHSGRFGNDFLGSLSNWDGRHYLNIAQKGYVENFQYAFFPLFPLLIRFLNQLVGNILVSALLISLLSSFLGLHLLYKLIVADFDKKLAEKVIMALIFFPTSFYFLTVYSEGLFFLLVVLTFHFLRSNRIFWATITAALASATRLEGLALVLALLVEIQTTSGINRKNWWIVFSLAGFSAYSIFLYKQTTDPFYFISAQKYWQRQLSIPGAGFWETLRSLTSPGFISAYFSSVLDLLFAIFGVGLTLRSFRFLPLSFSFYAFASIILPLLTPTLSSVPRFLLPIFPLFILIGLIKNKYLALGYQIISLMLLSVFTILFINGYWVA